MTKNMTTMTTKPNVCGLEFLSSHGTTFSPELTFVPDRAPYEIVEKQEGERFLRKVNRLLDGIQLGLWAKLDPFHKVYDNKPTYCIEIVPALHLPLSWLGIPEFPQRIDVLFLALKKIGLVPSVMKRRKGMDIEYPTGGCHIHYGAALFPLTQDFYKRMEALHWLIIYELTNKPWLRWVFAQWFNDAGHHTIWNPVTAPRTPTPTSLFLKSFFAYCIEPRFMPTGKNPYLTYEFRFFRMVESGDELVRIARFVDKFMTYLVNRVLADKTSKLELTLEKWHSFSQLGVVEKEFKNLLDILHLPWQDYRLFYERNFLTRLKHGKLI